MKQQIKLENLAVLLIDMQDYFLREPKHIELIERQLILLEYCCLKKGTPLAVIEFGGCGETTHKLKNLITHFSLVGGKIAPFTKYCGDAFDNLPGLNKWLRGIGAKSLIPIGVTASYCLYKTAKNGKENKNFQIIFSEDLTTDYSKEGLERIWYKENTVFFQEYTMLLKSMGGF